MLLRSGWKRFPIRSCRSAGRGDSPMATLVRARSRVRDRHRAEKQTEWETQVAAKCAHWTVLDPDQFTRKYNATITKLPDHSLLYTGDNFYREEYKIEAPLPLKKITAIKLEVLPHPDLPKGGP